MTNKGAAFARALAAGMSLEEGARLAGYNLGYARKKAREPAFMALVERYRQRVEKDAEERDAVETLWEIINDPGSSAQERTQAIRALIAYDRAHTDRAAVGDVTIIDDIPPECKNCPNTGKFSTGGADDGTHGDLRPGDHDREGRKQDPSRAANTATAFR